MIDAQEKVIPNFTCFKDEHDTATVLAAQAKAAADRAAEIATSARHDHARVESVATQLEIDWKSRLEYAPALYTAAHVLDDTFEKADIKQLEWLHERAQQLVKLDEELLSKPQPLFLVRLGLFGAETDHPIHGLEATLATTLPTQPLEVTFGKEFDIKTGMHSKWPVAISLNVVDGQNITTTPPEAGDSGRPQAPTNTQFDSDPRVLMGTGSGYGDSKTTLSYSGMDPEMTLDFRSEQCVQIYIGECVIANACRDLFERRIPEQQAADGGFDDTIINPLRSLLAGFCVV